MTLDTTKMSVDDWPLVLSEMRELRRDNDALSKALLKLKDENKRLQASVKSSSKKLSFVDSTFGVANLCK